MSWFSSSTSSSSSSSSSPSKSSASTSTTPSGAPIAPTRTQRAACWAARDAFFACLDHHNILDSIADDAAAQKYCGKTETALQKECAGSWVTYFKQRRVMEAKKKAMLEGLKAEGAQEMGAVRGT